MEYKVGRITLPEKPKSQIIISHNLIINSDRKYNKLQKKMWKLFFNVDVEDVKVGRDE